MPSEDPQEPGCSNEFQDLQPQLLTLTCCSCLYPPQQMFTGSDLNLYYDVRHPQWYKRPETEQQRQRAQEAEQRAQELAQRLRELGIED